MEFRQSEWGYEDFWPCVELSEAIELLRLVVTSHDGLLGQPQTAGTDIGAS